MKNVNVRFVGFTDGLPPFGRQAVFSVALANGETVATAASLRQLGLVVPTCERNRLTDAMHTHHNAGLCDDHLTLAHPTFKTSFVE